MPLHNYRASEVLWPTLVQLMDSCILAAIDRHLAMIPINARPRRLAAAWSELARLRGSASSDPDYSTPLIGIPYCLKYMPHRVTSLVGAMSKLERTHEVQRVLDIGCGTGATQLAIDLGFVGGTVELVCTERAQTMSDIARRFNSQRVRRSRILSIDLEDLEQHIEALCPQVRRFDMIVMSACLSYEICERSPDEYWVNLADLLWNFTEGRGSQIVVVEPAAKGAAIIKLADALRASGKYRAWSLDSTGYPDHLTSSRPLPLMTNRLRSMPIDVASLSGPGAAMRGSPPWPLESWNPNQVDRALVAVEL